jgi:hypothetical protein
MITEKDVLILVMSFGGQDKNGVILYNAVANLYGKDGFAGIAVRKQDAQLALEPKFAEKHLRDGLLLCLLHYLVK